MNKGSFARRIAEVSSRKESRVVLALDVVDSDETLLLKRCLKVLKATGRHVCAVKLNLHVLLPLSLKAQRTLVEEAVGFDVQVVADLKLNDIASTNLVAVSYLWDVGFDAVIANPIAGFEGGLGPLIENAHQNGRGVIVVTYMSHPGASEVFGLKIAGEATSKVLYELFLSKAVSWGADGVVVGATVREVISIAKRIAPKLAIYSPGVGVQGGGAKATIEAGADYLIVGRSIVDSLAPGATALRIREETWKKT